VIEGQLQILSEEEEGEFDLPFSREKMQYGVVKRERQI